MPPKVFSFCSAVLLISLAALGLRLWQIDEKTLWYDELQSLSYLAGESPQETLEKARNDSDADLQSLRLRWEKSDLTPWEVPGLMLQFRAPHMPLYFQLAAAGKYIFGNTVRNARSISLIFGMLTILVAFWVGREIFLSTRVAILFGAMLSFSPFHLVYAQEARPYALWGFFSVLCLLSLARALRLKSRGAEFLFLISFAGLLQTHFLAIFSACVFPLYFWARGELQGRQSIRRLLFLYAPGIILYGLWALLLSREREAVAYALHWSSSDVATPMMILGFIGEALELAFFDFAAFGAHFIEHDFLWVSLYFLIFLVLAMAAWQRVARAERWMLFAGLLLPLTAMFFWDLLWDERHSTVPRYFVSAILWMQMIAAVGIARLWESTSLRQKIYGFSIALILFAAQGVSTLKLVAQNTSFAKREYDLPLGSMNRIFSELQPATLIVEQISEPISDLRAWNLMALALTAKNRVGLQWVNGVSDFPRLKATEKYFLYNASEELRQEFMKQWRLETLDIPTQGWSAWSIDRIVEKELQ